MILSGGRLRDLSDRVRRPGRSWAVLLVGFIYLGCGAGQLFLARTSRVPVRGDSESYLRTARGIARCLEHPGWTADHLLHGGFSPSEREELGFDGWILQHAPLYLLPLGLSQAVGGGETGARFVSVLFLAFLGAFLFDLGRRLFSPLVAGAAAILFLLQPAALLYGTAILTEIPLAFLAVLGGWSLVRWVERRTVRRSVVLGLVLGMLYLGKITWRPLLPILVLLAAAYIWRRRDRVRLLGGLGVGLAAILMPWWLGLLAAGLPLDPIAESGEDMLWLYRGNNVHLQGWEVVGAGDAATPELLQAIQEAREADQLIVRSAYRRALLLQIERYPLEWLSLVGKKFVLFWTHPAVKHYTRQIAWSMPPWLGIFPWLALAALAGWLLALGEGRRWIPGLLALYLAAGHAVSHIVSRYNVPALPLVALYATAGPWMLARQSWRRPCPWDRKLGLLAAGVVGSWVASVIAAHPPWCPAGTDLAALSWFATVSRAVALALLAWLAAAALGRLARLGPIPRRGILAAGAFGGSLVLAWRIASPDWDSFSVRLRQAGDGVVQKIAVPRSLPVAHLREARLAIDMLRSISGEFTLDLFVNERQVRSFEGGLDARPEDFVLDPVVHGYQERHLRILETLEEDARGHLAPRYGNRNPGLDAYRRWVEIPLEPRDILGRDTVTVRLVLRRAGRGAWVEVFGDGTLGPGNDRVYRGPAFFTNAYLLSNYRFRLLAGDRREADYRLTDEVALDSPWAESLFLRGGRPSRDLSRRLGCQGGEYRIRLRLRLPGQYVWREEGGRSFLGWVRASRPGDRLPSGEELRKKMTHYRDYFDGFATL